MADMNDVYNVLTSIETLVRDIEPKIIINGDQITVVGGLSDISESLGVVTAGEFRTGNGKYPSAGFSGMRMAYPGMTYGTDTWNLVGVENDVLQFGVNANNGKLYAGGGKVIISAGGIAVGNPPPTASNAGTGIWIGETGLFSLDTDVYQVKIDTTNGIFYAGAGALTIDATGLKYYGSGTAGENRTIEWYDTSSGNRLLGKVKGDYGGTFGSMWIQAWKQTGDPWSSVQLVLAAIDTTSSKDVRIYIRTAEDDVYINRDLMVEGNYISRKNSTEYTGYIFVPLTTPLTSTSWDGDSFSTTAKTVIDLSAVFGVPAGVKAILCQVTIRDSASSGGDYYIFLGANNTAAVGMITRCNKYPDDGYVTNTHIVPCDSNGDIYYQINASGASTFDVFIQIHGYFI